MGYKIIIDEDKCTGCGLCTKACVQKAIELVDGKAKVVRADHCDGLGNCIGQCPNGAIKLEKTERSVPAGLGEFSCPGLAPLTMSPSAAVKDVAGGVLGNWPVQLKLVSAEAGYFENAHLLIAADCTAFASPGVYGELSENKVVVIGCPKLDDAEGYIEKLTEILVNNSISAITIAQMEVPCCQKLNQIVKQAMENANCKVAVNSVVIAIDGAIKEEIKI